MSLSPEQGAKFTQSAEKIQSDLKTLLNEYREALGEEAPDALVFAENDLYDALDCLSDFIDAFHPPAKGWFLIGWNPGHAPERQVFLKYFFTQNSGFLDQLWSVLIILRHFGRISEVNRSSRSKKDQIHDQPSFSEYPAKSWD